MEFPLNFWVESLIKLILGFILAGIIGSERQSVNKPAGFKTHSLIGISAVLIMLCGEYLSKITGEDSSRLPSQLLSGIGFIGAGTILTDGFNVKGLTTAASLLAVTCIGLSIGAGFYIGGITVTIIVYFILSFSHRMFGKMDYYDSKELRIITKNAEETIENINTILEKHIIEIKKIKITNSDESDEESNQLNITFRYKRTINLNKFISEISTMKNVYEVEEI